MIIYKQSVHINHHQCLLQLQLLWWNAKVCKILLVNKILLVANKKSFFHRKIKICGNKFCSAVQSGPASDLPSKSFTWKDINSNSIAIQTSPSLKGWQDEWRLVQTMPLHRAERTWECTWRVNTQCSSLTVQVCPAFSSILPFCVPVGPAWWTPCDSQLLDKCVFVCSKTYLQCI